MTDRVTVQLSVDEVRAQIKEIVSTYCPETSGSMRKIEAIKTLREKYDFGLKESKELIEAEIAKRTVKDYDIAAILSPSP
jgi:ribosomal protein L7/L12